MSSVPNELEQAANGTTGAQPAWKRELNDKIVAARARRNSAQQAMGSDSAASAEADPNSRTSRVAAAVAARYADAPSYSEYLAQEVRAAMMAAVAAQAAINLAREAEPAIETFFETSPAVEARMLSAPAVEAAAPAQAAPVSQPVAKAAPTRKAPPAPRVDHAGFPYTRPAATPQTTNAVVPPQSFPAPGTALTDPLADALVTPATALPAKLLEFPRELIAARKARPRHAEGPLRDGAQEETGQLRIFEVEPSAISTTPEAPPQATEWSSIRLDAQPMSYAAESADHGTVVTSQTGHAPYNRSVAHAQSRSSSHPVHNHDRQAYAAEMLPHVAGLADRLMAGIVDAALVGIAFVLFVFVFASSTAHLPTGKPAVVGGAIVLTVFYLMYQLLFFTFAEGTPGMRYARIALCTFEDDNPTRDAMRKRIFALVLAAAPLGLGFLYAFFDEDGLGWHDRMTRMYQRSYK